MFAALLLAGLGALRAAFCTPPDAARLQAWWHWMDDEYTESTLDRDIEALHSLGVRAAYVFVPGAYYPIDRLWAPMMSEKWLSRFDHALMRAKELGMTLGFHNCPGWSSSGGPWVPPEKSMKIVVAGERDLRGDETEVTVPKSAAVREGFHRDIALLAAQVPDIPEPVKVSRAFPTLLRIAEKGASDATVFEFAEEVPEFTTMLLEWGDDTFHTHVTVEASADGAVWTEIGDARLKYFHAPPTPKPVALAPRPAGTRFLRVTFRYVDAPAHIRHFDVKLAKVSFASMKLDASALVDCSSAMNADGQVDLAKANLSRPPEGRHWRLIRFGFTTTGKCCSPATLRGLEVDKLDRSALDLHWANMPAKLLALPHAKGFLTSCVIDSYEAGVQNWTDDMPEKFRRLRGYEIRPWLPAMTGYTIGTPSETERFLSDLRQTVSDLFISEYYGHFTELCHAAGIESVIEGYDGPYDPLKASMCADVPCGEFWINGTGAGNARADKTPTWAASAAHLTGRTFVAAESFTSGAKEGRWQTTPADQRVEGDRAWLYGVNRLVLHSYVAQPFENVKPGLSLAAHGTHLNRNQPWFPEARGWSDYVARGQVLLQAGESRAEYLVIVGDRDFYACEKPPKGIVDSGANFDWVPESMASEHAGKYEAVVRDPSQVRSVRPFADSSGRLWSRRRDLDDAIIYYLLNDSDADFDGDVSFAAKIRGAAQAFAAAERWTAEDGSIAALAATADGDRLSVRLKLAAHRSAFVVLSKGGGDGSRSQPVTSGQESASPFMDLSGDWQVTFDGPGAPEAKAFAKLQSWSESDDPKLKYFSGRARYSKTVTLHCPPPPLLSTSSLLLSLGEVHDIANVYVDGQKIATLWESPYEVEFTPPGKTFRLEIEVVNSWPNRMIGDAIVRRDRPDAEPKAPVDAWFPPEAAAIFSRPTECFPQWVVDDRTDSGTGIYTWSNYDFAWGADEPLKPAGLIGPVRLREMRKCK